MVLLLIFGSCSVPTLGGKIEAAEIWTTSTNSDFTTSDIQTLQIDSSNWVVFISDQKYNYQVTIELKILGSDVRKIQKFTTYEYKNGILDLNNVVDSGIKLINTGKITRSTEQYAISYDHGLVSGTWSTISPTLQETYLISRLGDSLTLNGTGDVYHRNEDIAPNI